MTKLWYTDDEVRDFHPLVQLSLQNALLEIGFENILEVVHHPHLQNSEGVPDFILVNKSNRKTVLVLEVKKTIPSCYSGNTWKQAREYVIDSINQWDNHYRNYYLITNCEILLEFCHRPNYPVIGCALKNYEKENGRFDPFTHDAGDVLSNLQREFVLFLRNFVIKGFAEVPVWQDNWLFIIDSLKNSVESTADIVSKALFPGSEELESWASTFYPSLSDTNIIKEHYYREMAIYDYFRILAFSFLKQTYEVINHPNASYFLNFKHLKSNVAEFLESIEQVFGNAMQLDFKQIFQNKDEENVIPDNFSEVVASLFSQYIELLDLNISSAMGENGNANHLIQLIFQSSGLYSLDEMSQEGKIMTDKALAEVLSNITIEDDDETVIDPCCGNGSLIDSAYDRLLYLDSLKGKKRGHKQLLSQVFGIEIDPFFSQLSAFVLLSKNLSSLDKGISANVRTGDMFKICHGEHYDVVLMNPPFLRFDNNNRGNSVLDSRIKIMEDGIKEFSGSDSAIMSIPKNHRNLYYYFVEYALNLISSNGTGGFILYSKFLNSKSGEVLKALLKDKISHIITYPRTFFRDFTTSTCIIVLKKGTKQTNDIKFIRIRSSKWFDENSGFEVLNFMNQNSEISHKDYMLRILDKSSVSTSSNWRRYLLLDANQEKKIAKLKRLSFMKEVKDIFVKKGRGTAGNAGGSKDTFFGPTPGKLTKYMNQIEPEFIGFGLKRNEPARSLILTQEDLNIEKGLHVPHPFDNEGLNGLENGLALKCPGLAGYYLQGSLVYKNKWKGVINNTWNALLSPQIIIPRGSREKHAVFYMNLPGDSKVLLSTNFVYLDGLVHYRKDMSLETQLKFECGFLMSCFGQIEMEIESNNQEGDRKMELVNIKALEAPRVDLVDSKYIIDIADKFQELNDILKKESTSVKGNEGIATRRRKLDLAVGKMIWAEDSMDFESSQQLVDFFELMLASIVEDRGI